MPKQKDQRDRAEGKRGKPGPMGPAGARGPGGEKGPAGNGNKLRILHDRVQHVYRELDHQMKWLVQLQDGVDDILKRLRQLMREPK